MFVMTVSVTGFCSSEGDALGESLGDALVEAPGEALSLFEPLSVPQAASVQEIINRTLSINSHLDLFMYIPLNIVSEHGSYDFMIKLA
jgi:hypothetical protein